MTDLEQRANDEARHGNREALEQMTARLAKVEKERDEARADSDKWRQAFAAQSRKLQSVLHIEGVREALARPEETDALEAMLQKAREEERETLPDDIDVYRLIKKSGARSHADIAKVIAAAIREDKT